MNPLQNLTPQTLETMKDNAHKRHIFAQGKKIYDHIAKLIDWQAKNVKSVSLSTYDWKYIYPENIKLLSCNGFNVYKITILHKGKNETFDEHHITWCDTDIEKDIIPNLFTMKEYSVVECKKL
jgi:hypothetical protein